MKKPLIIAICIIFPPIIFGAGYFLGKKNEAKKYVSTPIGTLYLDKSDEFDPYNLFLELSRSIESFQNKKEVTFSVVKRNFLPPPNVKERK